MSKPLIVVTGKNGQLGSELQLIAPVFETQYNFLFADRSQLDLSSNDSIDNFFIAHKPSVIINCAAYTAVDKAETDREAAFQINGAAVGKLAAHAAAADALFITVSTDYVFNGNGTSPYLPSDATDPVNYYGESKAVGEQLALTNNADSIIIRTSWVYSRFGNNFVKTITINIIATPIIASSISFCFFAFCLRSSISCFLISIAIRAFSSFPIVPIISSTSV